MTKFEPASAVFFHGHPLPYLLGGVGRFSYQNTGAILAQALVTEWTIQNLPASSGGDLFSCSAYSRSGRLGIQRKSTTRTTRGGSLYRVTAKANMRVSEHFQLNQTQPTLDFVDVDISGDVRLFVDPRALRLLPSEWAAECVSLVQDFFRTVMQMIRNQEHDKARRLLEVLREPNETHLGLSRKRAQGHALGQGLAKNAWESLRDSEATRTGLLENLEETILMVEGISSDIVSDILTNIIRQPLIHYTTDAASYYGIRLEPDVASGPLWDPRTHEWFQRYVRLPVTPFGKLLLVPKIIVRNRMDYDVNEYFDNYILPILRAYELAANSELVKLLRDGRRKVSRKALIAKYGKGKTAVIQQTLRHPDLLRKYRNDKDHNVSPPLDHDALARVEDSRPPDWENLLHALAALPTGREADSDYERAVEKLLTALLYPALTNPRVQHEIHDGRKRIDITYVNASTSGFFNWLGQHYPAAHVFVECKNYGSDLGNPELDQLSGRFSPSRGQFGLLVCRSFQNKNLFVQRCVDTAHDHRGFIIALDDQDLGELVAIRQSTSRRTEEFFFRTRFEHLIM